MAVYGDKAQSKMSKLKALGQKIIIKITDINKEDGYWSDSGMIWLPKLEKERNFMGKVEAIGEKVKDIKVEDEVIFSKYEEWDSRKTFKIDDDRYVVLDEKEVIAIIENENG